MIEILIQLLNDGKQYLYDFIRRLVNYKTVIGSSVELNQEETALITQEISAKNGKSKDYAFCILAFKNDDTWDLLLLNKKYKLSQILSITTEELSFLNRLDKNETYFFEVVDGCVEFGKEELKCKNNI